MISFEPFYEYLNEHEVTKYQLVKDGILLPVHVTRLASGHNFTLKFLDVLCCYLDCQPGDLIKYVPDDNYHASCRNEEK